MTEIAIAYVSPDRERVRPFYDLLRAKEYDVFWDQDLDPGDPWDKDTRLRFDAATCVLVFLSQNALRSNHFLDEAQIALSKGKHIPIMLDKLAQNDVPSGYSATQSLEVPENGLNETVWETLDKGLKKVMKGRAWVRNLIAQELIQYTEPLRSRVEALENDNTEYQATISELQEELSNAKKLFAVIEKAIDKVQLQNERLTSGSETLRDSLEALKKYLCPESFDKSKVN